MRRSALLLLLVLPLPALAQEANHPLDELTAAEHWALYETLRAHDGVEEDAEFLYAGLNEPSKAEILAWRPGQPFGRQARVHLAQSHTGYEAVVDVANRTVLEFREVTDRQYMAAPMDDDALADLKEHPDMVAAFEARGITDMSKVRCFVGSDAYFDTKKSADGGWAEPDARTGWDGFPAWVFPSRTSSPSWTRKAAKCSGSSMTVRPASPRPP